MFFSSGMPVSSEESAPGGLGQLHHSRQIHAAGFDGWNATGAVEHSGYGDGCGSSEANSLVISMMFLPENIQKPFCLGSWPAEVFSEGGWSHRNQLRFVSYGFVWNFGGRISQFKAVLWENMSVLLSIFPGWNSRTTSCKLVWELWRLLAVNCWCDLLLLMSQTCVILCLLQAHLFIDCFENQKIWNSEVNLRSVSRKCFMHGYIPSFIYGYGSIPINTIFRGMNIHLPAILMFTRGIGFWPIPIWISILREFFFIAGRSWCKKLARLNGWHMLALGMEDVLEAKFYGSIKTLCLYL